MAGLTADLDGAKTDLDAARGDLDAVRDDLAAADAHGDACLRAAEVARRTANAGIWLRNEIAQAAGRWDYTFGWYLARLVGGFTDRLPVRPGAIQKAMDACFNGGSGSTELSV